MTPYTCDIEDCDAETDEFICEDHANVQTCQGCGGNISDFPGPVCSPACAYVAGL